MSLSTAAGLEEELRPFYVASPGPGDCCACTRRCATTIVRADATTSTTWRSCPVFSPPRCRPPWTSPCRSSVSLGAGRRRRDLSETRRLRAAGIAPLRERPRYPDRRPGAPAHRVSHQPGGERGAMVSTWTGSPSAEGTRSTTASACSDGRTYADTVCTGESQQVASYRCFPPARRRGPAARTSSARAASRLPLTVCGIGPATSRTSATAFSSSVAAAARRAGMGTGRACAPPSEGRGW